MFGKVTTTLTSTAIKTLYVILLFDITLYLVTNAKINATNDIKLYAKWYEP
jgi:hypothetical protein